jgi:hypothetical protein
VSDSYCQQPHTRSISQTCNTQYCPAHWQTSYWLVAPCLDFPSYCKIKALIMIWLFDKYAGVIARYRVMLMVKDMVSTHVKFNV